MFERQHDKARRARAVAESIPGVEVASDQTTVEIHEDGRLMRGGKWTTPDDYLTDDIESGRLPTLKGATPTEWPTLEPTG